jgi:hypothetical protein
MSSPIIILGAGASHDFVHPEVRYAGRPEYQSPVTKDIFSSFWVPRIEPQFTEKARDLISYIVRKINPNRSFESLLTERINKFGQTPRVNQEVMALTFYLQSLFKIVSSEIGDQRGNNYEMLVDECRSYLELHPDESVIFATFNYDSLLEQSIPLPYSESELSPYVEGRIKVIKLHGSSNWSYYL